jgi:PAS domain S-box-containing protein
MWIYDQETLVFLEVNHPAEKLYGFSRQEFLRMTILDICPVEDIPKILKLTLHPLENGPVSYAAFRHRNKAGNRFKVEVSTQDIVFRGRLAKLVLIHKSQPCK